MSKHESLREAQLDVMEDVGYVQKLGKVGTGKFGYTYAGEKELIAQLRPSMVTHGVVMYPVKSDVYETESYTTEKGSRVSIVLGTRVFRFEHVHSGDYTDVEVFAEASDRGDKRASKAMTLAKKYALREFFLIATGDAPDAEVTPRSTSNEDIFMRASAAINKAEDVDALEETVAKIRRYNDANWSEEQTKQLSDLAVARKIIITGGEE